MLQKILDFASSIEQEEIDINKSDFILHKSGKYLFIEYNEEALELSITKLIDGTVYIRHNILIEITPKIIENVLEYCTNILALKNNNEEENS